MAKCKCCNKKGFFLRVDESGLCRTCMSIISNEAESRLRVIKESNVIVEKSKNVETIAFTTGLSS